MHKTVKCWKFYSSNQFKKICIYVADEDKIIEKLSIVWITLKKISMILKLYIRIFFFCSWFMDYLIVQNSTILRI